MFEVIKPVRKGKFEWDQFQEAAQKLQDCVKKYPTKTFKLVHDTSYRHSEGGRVYSWTNYVEPPSHGRLVVVEVQYQADITTSR